jgi:GNAT superfamily N-acetyltransferase
MKRVDLSNIKIKTLTEEDLSYLDFFDCGDDDLNEFIREDAIDHIKGKVAVTYLATYNERPLGYFCISMFAIKPEEEAMEILNEKGKRYNLFPALIIGRLGVDKTYERSGVGTEMIKTTFGLALELSEKVGCRFIVVDAYNKAVSFYEKNGFRVLSQGGKDTTRMYLDLLREL